MRDAALPRRLPGASAMSRRTLLSAEGRSRLFGIPTDRAEMATH
jgi:hypothetical protein